MSNIIRFSDMKSRNVEPSAEDIIKWFMDDLARETELAINIAKGTYFKNALTLINEVSNQFPQNIEETINMLRESLTKITTEASNAYSKL